ncbi:MULTISPECIES: hypothetical protein [unclassified Arthrobacter]|jgi:hypothetical protein|nr:MULTISPECIES: hypothetical protein [unclassified Arthrobacter]MDF2051940.1 hypothetical protein [Arthrobacter sp. Cr_A7]SLK03573.1 hypothetical protein SAMN06272721_104231 [Arthrobacter sp. P2b]
MAKNVKHETAEAPLRRATPAPHWKKLRQGDRVRVLLSPGFETGGLVDAITPDNTVVWINLDGGRGRTLLHCGDGIEILPHED